ncbi:hypothetical protein LCGC14_2014280 [marine sediment metagenome]|uniref:Uncharacterized protein n=1 Tax=marine sediment metagenome TaxID=412755 RepID=A0A0F9HWM5_9ZZZZ
MECCQDGCGVPAHLAVYWPSSKGPYAMCLPHAEWAHHVADVMGFKLPLGPIDPLLEPLAKEVEETLGNEFDG